MPDGSRTDLFSRWACALLTSDIQEKEHEARDEVLVEDTLTPAPHVGVGFFRNSGALAFFSFFFFFPFFVLVSPKAGVSVKV